MDIVAEKDSKQLLILDEIDRINIDQLHHATTHISQTCFEYKKMCVTVLGAVAAFTINSTGNQITERTLILAMLVTFGFWVCDATAYYYQKKLRLLMDLRKVAIAKRNQCELSIDGKPSSWFVSFFNESMALYIIMLSILIILYSRMWAFGPLW